MIVNKITLNNFRNYEEQTIWFDKGINIIHGKNGHGKTNILESIFMCSTAKSDRTNRYKEMVNVNTKKKFFVIRMDYERNGSQDYIMIQYNNKSKKYIYNDIELEKTGELMTKFNSVLFTPEDLNIVKGGPDKRRKFLDMFICQTDKSYFYLLKKYNRVIKQKNVFLKMDNDNKEKDSYISILNNYVVNLGTRIIERRLEILCDIEKYAKYTHKEITQGAEKLSFEYVSVTGKLDHKKNNSIKENFKKKIENNKNREYNRKTSLFGPHRDDVIIKINDMEARHYGSQGQIRTAALSLKLSQADIIKEKRNVNPVILLDDVLSELDINRRKAIVSKFTKNQIIITSTDKEEVLDKENQSAKYIFVQKGKIIV